MATKHIGTQDQIISAAREVLTDQGLTGLSFDAIARRIGLSKQAVLYWYPTKPALLAALFLPWLQAEAQAATLALRPARGRRQAIEAFVRAVARFHLADVDRFRLMYLLPQVTGKGQGAARNSALTDAVHPVTDELYSALAARLGQSSHDARAQAVAIHCAVLGLVTMAGLANAIDDPLKQSADQLIDALIEALTRR